MKTQFRGLSEAEVRHSRQNEGGNSLPPPETETFFEKLKENFQDPLIKILCIALSTTVILAFLGYADWIETVGIGMAVFIATFVSTYSEHKNEESFQKLQEEASRVFCTVFRNGGDIVKIPIQEIVVGDFVLLDAGALVPADGVVVHGKILVNQKSLTGEPISVSKVVPLHLPYIPPKFDDCDDKHLIFRGSVIDDGEAVMRVSAVGKGTVYGRLAIELSLTDDRESPLQYKLGKLADAISRMGYIGSVFIAISFLFKQYIMDTGYTFTGTKLYLSNYPVQAFQDLVTAVILAIIIIVVAVPEGLPMMIAIVLSLNMRRLLHDNVLVRKLLGIETAGSLSLLFCDKTGTLTKGEFEPELFISAELVQYRRPEEIPHNLSFLLSFTMIQSSQAFKNQKTGQILGGNASDRALVSFLSPSSWKDQEGLATVESSVVFSSIRKFSASQVHVSDELLNRFPFLKSTFASNPKNMSNSITLVKGAPEILLPLCTSYYTSSGEPAPLVDTRRPLEEEMEQISSRGVRVILLATTRQPLETEPNDSDSIQEKQSEIPLPNNLCLVGIMGVSDQVRPNTAQALQQCINGGIQTVMITGDKKETAISVAQQIGLIHMPNDDQVLTSPQLRRMSDDQIIQMLPQLRVIARALPTDKSRLVKLAQISNHVVGMTGDGVNDSAALRNADVGFAMGSGAEVAKEAADIVILDDNFSSIARAVLYGRTIFKTIRRFIIFQSTVNLASCIIVFLGPFLGFDFPLSLIQLLWVNLVMDTFAAIAHGGSPPHQRYMNQRPIRREESIISIYMWTAILANGLFIAFLSLVFLMNDSVAEFFVRNGKPDEAAFLTGFFCFFIFISNFNSLNVRTKSLNIFEGITQNKNFLFVLIFIFVVQVTFTYFGGNLLKTVGLTFSEWVFITLSAMTIIPFDIMRKAIIVPKAKAYFKYRPVRVERLRGFEVV